MALDKQGYPVGFVEWWQKNVTAQTNPSLKRKRAEEGRRFLAALLAKEQGRIDKKQEEIIRKEAQNNANIVGIGTALGAPVAKAVAEDLFTGTGKSVVAEKLGGLLGLGDGASVASTTTPAVASNVGAGGLPGLSSAMPQGSLGSLAEIPTSAAAAAPSGWSLGGIGSAGNYLAPAAGIIGLGDVILNKRRGTRGALQGAASGAAIGSYFGPWGTAIGAGVGGLASAFNKKTTKETQSDRWKDVGRSDLDVVGRDYFAGTGGEKSRDESFLTPDAIRSNPDNYHAAADWDKWSREQQDQFLSTLLAEKKVQERKGGIYYDDARAKQLADQIRNGGLPAAAAPTAPAAPSAPARSSTRSPGIDMNGNRMRLNKLRGY